MSRAVTPPDIRPPFARYSHAIEVASGSRLLFCSGQVGAAPDDAIPAGAEEQTVVCFENIRAILRDAGMTFADVVRINAYVAGRQHLKPYMAVRDRYFDLPPPASTLIVVSGFARPEFLVEVEAIAARP